MLTARGQRLDQYEKILQALDPESAPFEPITRKQVDGLRWRHHLLTKQRQIWIEGYYTQRVRHGRLLPIHHEHDSRLLENPWKPILELPVDRRQPCSTPIEEVFEESGHSLLIVGAPGAGKTILLLELLQELAFRAHKNTNAPFPVLLKLNSWTSEHDRFEDWVLAELESEIRRPYENLWILA